MDFSMEEAFNVIVELIVSGTMLGVILYFYLNLQKMGWWTVDESMKEGLSFVIALTVGAIATGVILKFGFKVSLINIIEGWF